MSLRLASTSLPVALLLACAGLAGTSLACTTSAVDDDDEAAAKKGEVTRQNPFGLTPEQCEASPAPAVFGNALCVCGDFADVGNLVVGKGADGSLGSVGVNGATKVINNTKVEGAWASAKQIRAIGNLNVGRSLYTPSDLEVAGNVEIGQNLQVGGGLSGFGRLAVKGEAGVQGQSRLIGYSDIKAKGAYKSAPASPCGCKGSPGYLDVEAAIDKAKAKNDNTSKKLPTSMSQIGYQKIELDTGAYYFAGSTKSIGFERIRVKGAVSIYIDGSLEQIGAEVFDIADGSTLDVYVRGTLKTIGHFRVGDTKQVSSLRFFIGGGDEISLAIGNQIFHGSIYAPNARLKYVGNTVVEGSLFAGELVGIGNFEIHNARPKPPMGCPGGAGGGGGSPATPPGSTPGSSGGAGSGSGEGGGSSSGQAPPDLDDGSRVVNRDDGVGTPPLR
ncbi:MAG: hypothetical protein JST00_14110 [Deltaproteobacteria bacterium]|nr:hypothetical protein [Deltaproteobacteria bacterium]